jgi:hypothetical protein
MESMKLAAIYNVWHDWDLLRLSVANMQKCVDGVILVVSEYSNYGERDQSFRIEFDMGIAGCSHFIKEPDQKLKPVDNERAKRNYGLEIAKKAGYTHFIMMDCDELYEPEQVKEDLKEFEYHKLNGLVCGSQVYFKSPQLTIGIDTTLVPYIHKITPELKFEWNKAYPMAWVDGQIRIDPTRQLNITSGVRWSQTVMHHYSWVRRNIEVKIRNSTARSNIERSTLRQDYLSAKEGYFVNFYGKSLVRAQVDFKIPEMNVSDI